MDIYIEHGGVDPADFKLPQSFKHVIDELQAFHLADMYGAFTFRRMKFTRDFLDWFLVVSPLPLDGLWVLLQVFYIGSLRIVGFMIGSLDILTPGCSEQTPPPPKRLLLHGRP